MRPLIPIILCLFVGMLAKANDVSTVVDTEGEVFAYELRSGGTKELLFWAASSYQPEDTGSREFCVQHTQGAEIKWNEDHSAVAITESNHRFIGEVLLLQQGQGSHFENMFTASLQNEVLKRTPLNWERYRFFFEEWTKEDTAALRLVGLYYTDETKALRETATFRILLHLHNSNPIISVDRIAE